MAVTVVVMAVVGGSGDRVGSGGGGGRGKSWHDEAGGRGGFDGSVIRNGRDAAERMHINK